MASAASTCSRRWDRERRVSSSGSSTFWIRRQHRDEVVHLKDKADVPGAPFGELAARHVGDLIARHGNGAGGGNVKATEQVEQRGFSRAARPHEADEVALIHVQIEALQNLNLLAAPPVGLVKAADLDQGVRIPVGVDCNHVPLLRTGLQGRKSQKAKCKSQK